MSFKDIVKPLYKGKKVKAIKIPRVKIKKKVRVTWA